MPSDVASEVRDYLATLDAPVGARAEFDALFKRDYHTCDCAWPHISRAWGGAVGVYREIRLCCMAQALEQLMGLPAGTFYFSAEFTPLFSWDAKEEVKIEKADGTIEVRERGAPPDWMLQRMQQRGIEVQGLD
jgi:hypothetical protein